MGAVMAEGLGGALLSVGGVSTPGWNSRARPSMY